MSHARTAFANLLEAEKCMRLCGQAVPAKLKRQIKAAEAAIRDAEAMDGEVPCFKCKTQVDLEGEDGEIVVIQQRFPPDTKQLKVYGHLEFGHEFVLCAKCSKGLDTYMAANEEEMEAFT